MNLLSRFRRRPQRSPADQGGMKRWTVLPDNLGPLLIVEAEELRWAYDGKFNEDGSWESPSVLAFNDDSYAWDRAACRIVCPPGVAELFTSHERTCLMSRTSGSAERQWPDPLGKDAYHGVVGDYARLVDPHTEGDPAAVLIQTLVCLGNAMGRDPHFYVEATRHGTNLFGAIVGDTSMARKGTSLDRARTFALAADPAWGLGNDGEGGLSTAEGLIFAVRDPSTRAGKTDEGVADKRFLAAMSEFAETLARMKREGNPLGATMRNAWDGRTLRVLTRKSPLTASDAHISVIGHITQADLDGLLDSTDVFNGFGNRFLWVMARRSKLLPEGGGMRVDDPAVKPLVQKARAAVIWGDATPRRIEFDPRARKMWPKLYEELGRSEGGRVGAITDRAEPQVRRLALIYAVLDKSTAVRPVHLRAALAVWRYCEDSAAYLFADAPTPGPAGRILATLRRRNGAGWASKTVISQKGFKGELKSYKLTQALEQLVESGVVETRTVPTLGRPRREYRIAK
jgi:hypothetical protein